MKRLLTHSQLKHTKQAANKFLTCFIAAIMAVALSLPAAGIPTLSFADEPNQGSESVSSTDLEQGDGATDQINKMAQLTKSIILKARILVTVLMAVTLGVIMGLTVDCQMDQIQIRMS